MARALACLLFALTACGSAERGPIISPDQPVFAFDSPDAASSSSSRDRMRPPTDDELAAERCLRVGRFVVTEWGWLIPAGEGLSFGERHRAAGCPENDSECEHDALSDTCEENCALVRQYVAKYAEDSLAGRAQEIYDAECEQSDGEEAASVAP